MEQKELVRKAQKGDTKAFSQLYAGIYRDLYKFALYMTKHPQDAEDAVSETVITAFENISQLKKEESFKNWMFTILNRKCMRILNKRFAQNEPQEEEKNQASENPDYAQQTEVREAFASLEEEERAILSFSVFGGYKSEEIAKMLEKNPATVRSKKSRALGKMRALLGSR